MTLALVVALAMTQAPDAGVDVSPPVSAADPRDEAIQALSQRLDSMQAELEELKSRPSWVSKLAATFSGYLDVGFFWAQGDGSGVRKDFGHRYAPQYEGVILGSWVLLGDPQSTAINSRGDVADVGDARAVTFDPVHSGGRPGFLVNTLSTAFFAQIADGLTLDARIDFLPRDLEVVTGPNDLIDFKLAYLRYVLDAGPVKLAFFGGKFDSVLGFEYRVQESPSRVGVTPSLICRYTCGRPIGFKVRGEFFDEHLEVSLSVTNGSYQTHTGFSNLADFNGFKTLAARVIARLPVEPRIVFNLNGAVGPQDRQRDDSVVQWHAGAGAAFDYDRVFVTAEYVIGRANGKPGLSRGVETPCAGAPCLQYQGLYVLGGFHVASWLTTYARFDWRSAVHRDGDRFVYLSDVARATAGLNLHPWQFFALKAEYVFNRELGGYEFPDDVFTTSLVVSY
jgi:hypothetical protein